MNLFVFFVKFLCVLIKDIFISFINLFRRRSKLNISGLTALVTGGGNGLGREIAFQLAREGCKVAICDIDFEQAQRTCEEIKTKYNVSCAAFKVNVADCEQVAKLKDDIKRKKMGKVDILVNNAGILAPVTALEGDNSYIQRVIDVNLTSHFWTVRTFLPSMIEREQGTIVGICSILGLTTFPYTAAYSASKFGVNGFYRSLVDDLCMRDYDEFINVSCLYPGFINSSDIVSEFLDEIELILPRISVDSAAQYAVDAILYKTKFKVFPAIYTAVTMFDYLPFNTKKFVMKKTSHSNNVAIRKKFLNYRH